MGMKLFYCCICNSKVVPGDNAHPGIVYETDDVAYCRPCALKQGIIEDAAQEFQVQEVIEVTTLLNDDSDRPDPKERKDVTPRSLNAPVAGGRKTGIRPRNRPQTQELPIKSVGLPVPWIIVGLLTLVVGSGLLLYSMTRKNTPRENVMQNDPPPVVQTPQHTTSTETKPDPRAAEIAAANLEDKAYEEFKQVLKFEGLGPDEKFARIERLEAFQKKYSTLLIGARARAKIAELKGPPPVGSSGATGGARILPYLAATSRWHSYNLEFGLPGNVMKMIDERGPNPGKVEFYESADDKGIAPGTPLSDYKNVTHPEDFNRVERYNVPAGLQGRPYPYVGKRIDMRGDTPDELDTPWPKGVKDLVMHPPMNNHSTVAAFICPSDGRYVVSDWGLRRMLDQGDHTELKVFDPNSKEVGTLMATKDRRWVMGPNALDFGLLKAGQKIYFAINSAGEFGFDAAQVAWTISVVDSRWDDGPALGRPGPVTFLSDMKELTAAIGYGVLGKNGELGFDAHKVAVCGMPCPKGMGTHPAVNAPSTVTYKLNKEYKVFSFGIAINDDSGDGGSESPQVFTVSGDGRVLWSSAPIKRNVDFQIIDVNVTDIDVLEIKAATQGTQNNSHCVWIEPRLSK